LKYFFYFVICIFTAGCVALPIPYSAYDSSHIRGKVVDDETSQPIKGLTISIRGKSAVTDENGCFAFSPVKTSYIWAVYPLIPMDPFSRCIGQLDISDQYFGGGYRSVSIEVRSCRSLFGRDDARENLEIIDDIGVVRLSKIRARNVQEATHIAQPDKTN